MKILREYTDDECMVDVKTLSNFQFDIFWTFDDINRISICSFYKLKVLFLNYTQIERNLAIQ